MSRLNKERQSKLEPKRMEVAMYALSELGIWIEYRDETKMAFTWKGSLVTFFPYSGWHTGKTIKDGRGLQNLLNQLK